MISGPPDGGTTGAGDGWDSGDDGEEPSGSGWVPPELRQWRHPSELSGAPTLTAPRPTGSRRATGMAVAATTAAAMGIGALLLANAAAGPPAGPTALTVSTAAITACCTLNAAVASGTLDAMVTLTSRQGRLVGYGVVVGGGGLVATTTQALGTADSLMARASTGQVLDADLVGRDNTSGVALLRLPEPLPVSAPSISMTAEPQAGTPVMAVSLTRRGGSEQPTWTSGRVATLDATVAEVAGSKLALIGVHGAAVPDIPSDPLVDAKGRVVGILASAHGDERDYLPMGLVTNVAEELEMTGGVPQGWLDVTEATATDGAGVMVQAVESGGAASKVLSPGDVIFNVDGSQVVTCAELHTVLYGKAPGTVVTVEVMHQGVPTLADLVLSPSP